MAAITDLTTLAVADVTASDYVPIHDASAGTDKKTPIFESGTWTPVLKFGGATTGITYGTQSGNYRRIGAVVFVECRIALTSKGSATGSATITGLPYTVAGNATPISLFLTDTASTFVAANALVQTGGVYLYYAAAAFTTYSFVTNSIIGNTSTIWIGGCYAV